MEHKTLTTQGYAVSKSSLTVEEIKKIKKDLTMEPITLPYLRDLGFCDNNKFPIYLESKRRYWLPKYYGIQHYGPPEHTEVPQGNPIHIEFNAPLREHQIVPFNKTIKALKKDEGCILSLPCGFGKCLGYGTPVMLLNNTVKEVQNIKVGDLLVGDDNHPVIVMNTCKGREKMYSITQQYGINYTVNKSHILTLKHNNHLVDINVEDYLALENKHTYYTVKLKRHYFHNYSHQRGSKQEPYIAGKLFATYENYKKETFLYGYANQREEFLAGIIDHSEEALALNNDTYCIYVYDPFKMEILCKLIDGLGFGLIVSDNSLEIYAHTILPVRLTEIKTTKKHLESPPHIEELFEGTYYGFQVSGNGRFLLGDNTLTHNTAIAIKTITSMKKKALVVVHKEFLMDQWKESIERFTNARVGIIQQNKLELDADICIGMMHSLCLKDYPEGTFDSFGLMVIDECHHLGSEMFSKVLCKIGTKYRLGLSATPERRDGLHSVYAMHVGKLAHKEKRSENNQLQVKAIKLLSNDPAYKTVYMANGKTKNTTQMVSNITQCQNRNDYITSLIMELVSEGRRILVLSSRRNHLEVLHNLIINAGHKSVGFYYGNKGMNKKEYKKMLLVSAKCDIILATEQLAKEGLDIPGLDTLVMTTSIAELGALEQSIGRILRKFYTKDMTGPLVVDLVDKECGNFGKHYTKRKKLYKEEGYSIKEETVNLKVETLTEDSDEEEIGECVI